MEAIRSKLKEMKFKLMDEQMILHILNNLPEECDIQISKLESRMDDKNNPLAIDEV